MRRRSKWFYVAIVVVGALIGTAMGEAIGVVLPDGVVKEFFIRAAEFGFGPTNINIILIQFTIGLKIKLNIVGVIGILISAYIVKWLD